MQACTRARYDGKLTIDYSMPMSDKGMVILTVIIEYCSDLMSY